MKKILMVTGSGGHSSEFLALFKLLNLQDATFEFMLERDDPLTKNRIGNHKYYEVTKTRGKKEIWLATTIRSIFCFFESILIFAKAKPDVVLSAGPGLAVGISYLAKLFGRKVIFIESWSRVTTKSISGKLIYPIADKFYIQWPEMKKCYPKAIYEGRLG